MVAYSIPTRYRCQEKPVSKKLGAHIAWIDQVIEGDRSIYKKQQHSAHRIFERLRDEEGYIGGQTLVREYIADVLLRSRQMFVPLNHKPGHAQAERPRRSLMACFGQADAYIAGQKVRFYYFCTYLLHSDGRFVKTYPAETADAFLRWPCSVCHFL